METYSNWSTYPDTCNASPVNNDSAKPEYKAMTTIITSLENKGCTGEGALSVDN